MRAVVGLGNPGPEYATTRHNAGFWLADALVAHWELPPFRRGERARVTAGDLAGVPVQVLKPTTFMNASGAALASLRADPAFNPAADLLVLVDEFRIAVRHLPPAGLRLRRRAQRPQEHRGRAAVAAVRPPAHRRRAAPRRRGATGRSTCWRPFDADQVTQIETAIPQMVEAVERWVREGVT